MTTTGWIILAVIVVLVLLAVGIYNTLITLRQRVNQAFADIDVQLKQRHDLIPNLVETVKGYAAHERGTLEAVIQARNTAVAARSAGPDQHATYRQYGGSRAGAEQRMLQEWHFYFENTRRWRNLRKITVAQVQGAVYAAGLMLMWACDLIVAADNVVFADVVGTRLGMCGVE